MIGGFDVCASDLATAARRSSRLNRGDDLDIDVIAAACSLSVSHRGSSHLHAARRTAVRRASEYRHRLCVGASWSRRERSPRFRGESRLGSAQPVKRGSLGRVGARLTPPQAQSRCDRAAARARARHADRCNGSSCCRRTAGAARPAAMRRRSREYARLARCALQTHSCASASRRSIGSLS